MAEKEHDKEHASHGAGHGPGHGGGAHEEHEGAPEWLISFADNVTLMMGFFVILLAINMKPAAGGKGDGQGGSATEASSALLDTQIAVREAFNNPVDMSSTNPNDLPLIRRIRQKLEEGYSEHANAKGDDHDVQSIRPGDAHEIGGLVPFDNDAVAVAPAAEKRIVDLARVFRGKRMVIDVRGHASSAEAVKAGDKGMRLSFDRAVAVAQLLAREGVDWRQLRLVAYGDNDRIKPVTYQKSEHRLNAFVEVVATDEPMRVYTPQDDPATPNPSAK